MTRPSGGFTLAEILIIVAIAAVLLLTYAANSGYDTRRWVNEAIGDAAPLRTNVMEFRTKNGRWPEASDGIAFRIDKAKLKRARSVEYEPANRSIVITMDESAYPGKRFAFVGDEGPAGPEWGCKAIDIDTKYLPATCR